jgi:hypothetical protein
LLCILVWALMVMALMERQTRRSLKGKPMYGLYPENRPSPAPTGLDDWRVIPAVPGGAGSQPKAVEPESLTYGSSRR